MRLFPLCVSGLRWQPSFLWSITGLLTGWFSTCWSWSLCRAILDILRVYIMVCDSSKITDNEKAMEWFHGLGSQDNLRNCIKGSKHWAVVAHAFNPCTQEAEAGRALSWRPAWTTSEFQDSHSYKERLASKKEPQTPKSNEYTKTQQNKKLILFAQCFYTVRIPLPCWKAFLLSTNQGNLCACNLHKEQGKMAKQTKRCRFLNGYF